MATLNITKTYEDGTLLFETDIDNFRQALLDLINTTKLNADNVQIGGIYLNNMNLDTVDTNYLQYTSGGLQIKDNVIPVSKIATKNIYYDSIGVIRMFHTFNNTVSIPRGWMPCTGQVINETNYNAVHGAGTYASDNISTSALLNKYLPDFTSAYPLGASTSSLSQTGASPIPTAGSNSTNFNHFHNVVDVTTSLQGPYDVNGNVVSPGSLNAGPSAGLQSLKYYDTHTSSNLNGSTEDMTTGTTNISIDRRPKSYAVLFIMKVI